MAITRAQQVRQMLKDGDVAIQGGVENYLGRQPEVQAPRKWQSGPDKPATELAYITEAEKKLLLKEDIHGSLKEGPNEGPAGIMSLDSFGDIGGGQAGSEVDSGRSEDRAEKTTFSGGAPGESPADRKAREAKETARLNQLKGEQEKKAKEFTKQAKENRPNFLEKIFTSRRKGLYNITPNNPKNELRYIQDLKFRNPAAYDMLPDNLKALYEETEDPANEFSSYKDFDKFSFENFEDLRTFDPGDTGAMNFADYAATYAGAPGLKYSGDVGNLEKYVTGKDEFGRTMYGYKEKTGDGGGDNVMSEYERRLLELEKQNAALRNQQNAGTNVPNSGLGGLAPRFAGSIFDFTGLADGGRAGAMDGGMMRDTTEGGIMDLETGRQMYFLGKLVKKAKRAVKKVVKSPLGKAALVGLGAYYMPGFGIKATGGFSNFAKPGGFLSKILTKGGDKALSFDNLSVGKTTALGLGIPFALDLMGIGKDDEEDDGLDDYYRRNRIDIADIRNRPFNFLAPSIGGSSYAAGGGLMRLGYQEGGDAEPVAKKTMPLIDMDGQEKDYRETGGFVDMGRMERADDVPARLSKNEFVFTADAVRNAGEGDIDKGAEVMYNMMKNLESGGEVSEESQGLDGAREMFKTSQRLEEVL